MIAPGKRAMKEQRERTLPELPERLAEANAIASENPTNPYIVPSDRSRLRGSCRCAPLELCRAIGYEFQDFFFRELQVHRLGEQLVKDFDQR